MEGCPFFDDCAIVGARRYRGHRAPTMVGWVIAADFCSGRIRGLYEGPSGWQVEVLYLVGPNLLRTLGEGEDGELYVSDGDIVYRIQGLPSGFSDDFETGTLDAWSSAVGQRTAQEKER